MKTYKILAGSKYTLVQETRVKTLVLSTVADRDISFGELELVPCAFAPMTLHFHVGNKHYYTNANNVAVVS